MAPSTSVECIGDDVPYGTLTSFPRAVQAKDDEILVFSWIVYENRASRDAVMEKVMADPRLQAMMAKPGFRCQADDLRRLRALPGALSHGLRHAPPGIGSAGQMGSWAMKRELVITALLLAGSAQAATFTLKATPPPSPGAITTPRPSRS